MIVTKVHLLLLFDLWPALRILCFTSTTDGLDQCRHILFIRACLNSTTRLKWEDTDLFTVTAPFLLTDTRNAGLRRGYVIAWPCWTVLLRELLFYPAQSSASINQVWLSPSARSQYRGASRDPSHSKTVQRVLRCRAESKTMPLGPCSRQGSGP